MPTYIFICNRNIYDQEPAIHQRGPFMLNGASQETKSTQQKSAL